MKNDIRTSVNIRKITTGQGDDFQDSFEELFPGLSSFKKNCKMIAIDLSKQQALELNANPKAIQQINFTGSLDE